jgi:hypothetical protein
VVALPRADDKLTLGANIVVVLSSSRIIRFGLLDNVFVVVVKAGVAIIAVDDVEQVGAVRADGVTGDLHLGCTFRANDIVDGKAFRGLGSSHSTGLGRRLCRKSTALLA